VDPLREAEQLIDQARPLLPALTDEQRVDLFRRLAEDWCSLCGSPEPCYCALGYDE
jgi:hypothetical protein